MTDFIEKLSDTTDDINSQLDKAKQQVAKSLGVQDPLKILPYRGYGTDSWIYIKGRVLEKEDIQTLPEDAPTWKNVQNMYRRFESDEIPNAVVKITLNNADGIGEQTVTANEEGFFELEMTLDSPIETDQLWIKAEVTLENPAPRKQAEVTATGEILVINASAKFGVISDIDDTVVYTAANNVSKMVKIAYLGNSHSRRPFDGVEPFYQALQDGKTGGEGNPIFYVSSSPWNMYDLFDKFMSINDIPNGPILLKDIELSPDNLVSFSHEGHKRSEIEPIFDRLPELPFILIGDSGQKDPEIYQSLLQAYPERIMAIYIRDAVPDNKKRRQQIEEIADDVRAAGVDFILFSETTTVAKHAAQKNWIDSETVEDAIPESKI